MSLFEHWCATEEETDGRKHLWLHTEKEGGREKVWAVLIETVRSHYDNLDQLAEDAERLGYPRAACSPSAPMAQI